MGTAADDITRRWALVLAGTALVAVACTALARAATGWVVSPLRRMDRAVGQLAAGLPQEQTRAGGPPELRDLPRAVADALTRLLVLHATALVPDNAVGTQFLDVGSLIGTGGIPLHPGAVAAYRSLHG